jgi:hypothetical protein
MRIGIQRGYLVLADISGYTAYLSGTELEHAHGVIEDLTACIIERLGPPLELVKLEGDAVFVCAEAAVFSSGEPVLDLVERCYVGFRDRMEDVKRQTTCSCAACANIDTLDLKFGVHFGEFVAREGPAGLDVAGSDVIVAHRLLKNDIVAALGVRAYAFLTDAFAARLLERPRMARHSEDYETIGVVEGFVEDLAPVALAHRQQRRVVVEADEADFEVEIHLQVPRPTAWDWFTAPERMVQFAAGVTGGSARPNAEGRIGVGAELHCAHGSGLAINTIVDWKPFDYFTQDVLPVRTSLRTPPRCRTTSEFLDAGDGTTTVRVRVRLVEPSLRLRLSTPLVRRVYGRYFRQTETRFAALVANGAVR